MSINKPYSPDKTIFYMETGRRIWRIGHSLFLPGWIWWDPQLLPPGTILDMMERTSTATTRLAGYRYVDQSLVEWCCRYHVGLRHVTNWIAGSHFGAELMSTEKETTLTKLLLVITAILLISVTSSPSDLVSTPEPKYLCKSHLASDQPHNTQADSHLYCRSANLLSLALLPGGLHHQSWPRLLVVVLPVHHQHLHGEANLQLRCPVSGPAPSSPSVHSALILPTSESREEQDPQQPWRGQISGTVLLCRPSYRVHHQWLDQLLCNRKDGPS